MTYRLTARAADDFTGMYDHALLNAGREQADEYAESLAAFFETLSGMPGAGRDYPAVPGVMRADFRWHTVFYRVCDTPVLIARILPRQRDYPLHPHPLSSVIRPVSPVNPGRPQAG